MTVDLFGPGGAEKRRRPGDRLRPEARCRAGQLSSGRAGNGRSLAPPGYTIKSGDAVLSIGCDNGREPSVRNSHVTSTDKFLPPPNIQVAGQPVEGRSGGGLFTASGLLIGVCNAADPTDNEGLYAGISSIHGEIARKGLTQVIAASTANVPMGQEPLSMAKSMPPAEYAHAPRCASCRPARTIRAGRSEPIWRADR